MEDFKKIIRYINSRKIRTLLSKPANPDIDRKW